MLRKTMLMGAIFFSSSILATCQGDLNDLANATEAMFNLVDAHYQKLQPLLSGPNVPASVVALQTQVQSLAMQYQSAMASWGGLISYRTGCGAPLVNGGQLNVPANFQAAFNWHVS